MIDWVYCHHQCIHSHCTLAAIVCLIWCHKSRTGQRVTPHSDTSLCRRHIVDTGTASHFKELLFIVFCTKIRLSVLVCGLAVLIERWDLRYLGSHIHFYGFQLSYTEFNYCFQKYTNARCYVIWSKSSIWCHEIPLVIETNRRDSAIHISTELSCGVISLPCLVRLSGAPARLGLNTGIWFCCGWSAKRDQTLLTHHPPIAYGMQILVATATSRNRKLWWCHSVFWALPLCGCESQRFVFSADMGCFTTHVRACEERTVALKSVWRQPGSLWLVPWSRQCHWDYNYLHNSVAVPAINIWHLHLSMALKSQTGSIRKLPAQSLMSLCQ